MEKKKVLVVEDINQMFLLYRYCLDAYFDVVQAKTLSDLKNLVDKDEVVATILDYHIPGENFEDILKYIKESYSNSKIILISGHVDNLELKEKYEEDLDGVFSKPLDDYTKLASYLIDLVGIEISSENNSDIESGEELEEVPLYERYEEKEMTVEDIKDELLKREFNSEEIHTNIDKSHK